MKWVCMFIIKFVIIGCVGAVIGACLLIFSQRPDPNARGKGLDFSDVGPAMDAPTSFVRMRDGAQMPIRRWQGPKDKPLIIAIHGSGWHSGQFVTLGSALAKEATVIAPDLRGHGWAPERRGDIDYIGQLEDDLADLIKAEARAEQEVILLGHSSGGGLVIRMAGGVHSALIDRAVLLAPFVHHTAPTMRPSSGGWTKVLLRRMIGLSILNTFHIRGLNALTVVQFGFPDAVLNGPLGHTATRGYSYRLNTSYAPRRNYKADLAAMPDTLLLVGAEDEAFLPKAFAPLMAEIAPQVRVRTIPELSHLGLVNAPETSNLIRAWIAKGTL